MATVGYQNPVSPDLILQSVQITAGSPPTNAECVVPTGDPTGVAGLSIYRKIATAGTMADTIKNAAGNVYGWRIVNFAQYPIFVKLFNKASNPTVGSDTVVQTIPVQAEEKSEMALAQGLAYGTGIAIAVTAGLADADTSPVVASDFYLEVYYK